MYITVDLIRAVKNKKKARIIKKEKNVCLQWDLNSLPPAY